MSFNAIRQFPVCAAMLIAILALHMAPAQAQMVGSAVCPTNTPRINSRYMTIANEGLTSDAAAVTTKALGLDQVNSPYFKDGNLIAQLGTATSVRFALGLVDDDGNLVHNFYIHLGTARSGQTVPAQTNTFLSLQPGSRYDAAVFAEEIKGETVQARLPVVNRRPIVRECFQTAAGS